MEARRQLGGDVLDRMDGQLGSSGQDGLLDLFDEEALPTHLGQGNILNLVAFGLYSQQLDRESRLGLGQSAADPVRLDQGQLGAPGGDGQAVGQVASPLPNAARPSGLAAFIRPYQPGQWQVAQEEEAHPEQLELPEPVKTPSESLWLKVDIWRSSFSPLHLGQQTLSFPRTRVSNFSLQPWQTYS